MAAAQYVVTGSSHVKILPLNDGDASQVVLEGAGAHDDMPKLLRLMDSVPEKERVTHFRIRSTSDVKSLPFLSLFPRLEWLMIASGAVSDYSGMASSNIKWLDLSEAKPTRTARDLTSLSHLNLQKLEIQSDNEDELRVIALCSIKRMALLYHKQYDRLSLFPPTLEDLDLIRCGPIVIEGLSKCCELGSLRLIQCRRLETISDCSSSLRKLIVDNCPRFRFESLTQIPNLERLQIDSCKGGIELGAVYVPNVERISIMRTNVDFSGDWIRGFPSLKSFFSSTCTLDILRELSKQHEHVRFGCSKGYFYQGVKVSLDYVDDFL